MAFSSVMEENKRLQFSNAPTLAHKLVWVEEADKCSFLMELLSASRPGTQIIVIVATKGAHDLANYLDLAGYFFVPFSEKTASLSAILVTTSPVKPDLAVIQHVICFDLPDNIDEYLDAIESFSSVKFVTTFFNDNDTRLSDDLASYLYI